MNTISNTFQTAYAYLKYRTRISTNINTLFLLKYFFEKGVHILYHNGFLTPLFFQVN